MESAIDYPGLAAALLERAETLVPLWLPAGRKQGRYWYVGDFDGTEGESANVNLRTGAWGDNGRPGDSGRDLISLFGRIRGMSNHDAALELMREAGWRAATPTPRRREVERHALVPVPEDAPPYRSEWAHYARGVPGSSWEYRDRRGRLLGVVARFDTSDGGKEVLCLTYCESQKGRKWRYRAFPSPRPLYGLWRLGPPEAAAPGQVVIVEGERKADALFEALGRSVPVLSWPGGAKTPALADWSALDGVGLAVLWPDADAQIDKKTNALFPSDKQPGIAAMLKAAELLAARGVMSRIIDIGRPGARPGGWDAGDAVAEGWSRERLESFLASTLSLAPAERLDGVGVPLQDPPAGARVLALVPPTKAPPGAEGGGRGGGAGGSGPPAPPGDGPRWQDGFVFHKGAIRDCVANVMLVLHEHPQWRGVLAFDRFAYRVVKLRPAPYDPPELQVPAEWTDVDDTRTAAWIARSHAGFAPPSSYVAEAANETAQANPVHPVMDWLAALKHDGTPRLEHWLEDLLGVEASPYAKAVGRYFLVGMCRRVIEPGCKFDYCLVLEGPQGRLKSTTLRVLGGPWFSDTELDLAHKDSMSYIRGKWLHEFGELGSLARSEEKRQKSFLSRQIDEFRPTYGRREIRCPRQTAFSGTTNEWEWNKDPTGGRRFWPIRVGEVNLEALTAAREQLFAEAFAEAMAGARYWPTAEEQRDLFDPQQLAREASDAFVDMLGRWIDAPSMVGRPEFTIAEACLEGLHLDARSMGKDVQTRVGIALRKLGCERIERRNASNRYVYRRPDRKASSSVADGVPEGVAVPF